MTTKPLQEIEDWRGRTWKIGDRARFYEQFGTVEGFVSAGAVSLLIDGDNVSSLVPSDFLEPIGVKP